jgi:cytochrome c553
MAVSARKLTSLVALALFANSIDAMGQDAARGRALYAAICAICHADPPGSGSVNPLVRTADRIRAAINRISPMRFLAEALSDIDLNDIAAYFTTLLGPVSNAPEYDVTGQWSSAVDATWTVFVTQYADKERLTGAWLTYGEGGKPTWLYFWESGGWTSPAVYAASLFRNRIDGGTLGASAVGTIGFVFTDRNTVDVTIEVAGARTLRRAARTHLPNP